VESASGEATAGLATQPVSTDRATINCSIADLRGGLDLARADERPHGEIEDILRGCDGV
jgi:hypothetical protein